MALARDVVGFYANTVGIFKQDRVVPGGELALFGCVDNASPNIDGDCVNRIDVFAGARPEAKMVVRLMKLSRRR